MEWTFVRARPRWTRRAREDVRRERKDLGFPEEGPVRVIDVPLALRILGNQQLWRHFTFELSLTAFLLVLLLCYALGARYISLSFYIGQSVQRDLSQVFSIPTLTFDVNTPLNTSKPIGFYSDGTPIEEVSNLDPDTLKPIPSQPDLFYQQCATGGIPVNSSLNSSSSGETGWCLRFSQTKTFSDLRSIEEFGLWVSYMLNHSRLFTQVDRNSGRSVLLLGAIRIRQLRSLVPNGLVDSESAEETADLVCKGGSGPQDNSALQHQTAAQLNTFRSPVNPTVSIVGTSTPNLAQRLNFYYPSDGYAFDLPRCNPNASRDTWDLLVQNCDWISANKSSAFFVSLAGYDPVSDTQLFAQYSFQVYPQGTRLSTTDVRVFRVPGGSSDRAVVWRILLCAASLAELVFFLSRAIYRGTKAGSFWAAVNRWFVLDIISLIIIQAAVWLSIGNSVTAAVQAIATPEAMANLTDCSYPSHVTMFDAVSYDEKVEDLLLGISLILQGLKFFQLCQLSPRLSAAYSIINAVGYEILWWFILTSCVFFFFAFGANFLFGMELAQFYTLPSSMASAFLIFSKVPKYSMSASEAPALFGEEFWRSFENPNLAALMWELAEYMRPYEINVLFGFAFWLGLVVVLVYWILRNLLLGVVLSGYERIKRDIEAEELDVQERAMMKQLKQARRKLNPEISKLKRFADWMRQIAWRIWNNGKVDQLLIVLRTDPAICRRGLATVQEMEKIFKDIGIVRNEKSKSILDASKDPGEWFKEEFFANFEFSLLAIDEAILILSQQERPLALPLESVAAVRQAKTLPKAIQTLLEKCEEALSSYPQLPFVKELLESKKDDQKTERMFEIARRAAEKCPEVSGDEESHFDIQALVQRLGTRLNEEVEIAVERFLDRAAEEGDLSRIDPAVDLVYNSCVDDLGLYLDAIPDRDNVRMFIARELRRAKRQMDSDGSVGLSRLTESVVFELAEMFPCCLMGWQAEPTTREIERAREMFQSRFVAMMEEKDVLKPSGGASTRSPDTPDVGDTGSGEDGEGDVGEFDEYSVSSEAGEGSIVERDSHHDSSRILPVDEAGVSAIPSNVDMEDTFDPTAQQKWERALFSGEFFLSLTLIHALRSSQLADQLTRELMYLERKQINLEKELLSARRLLDEKISARKPLGTTIREVKKHGIEPHPNERSFHVHFTNPVTKEYKFVGIFFSQDEAEAAMTKTITQESATRRDSDLEETQKQIRDQDSWEEDDRHYALLAKELKAQKKQERKTRHQGGVLENPFKSAESTTGKRVPKAKRKRSSDSDDEDEEEEKIDEEPDDDDEEEEDREPEEVAAVGAGKNQTMAKKLADGMVAFYYAVGAKVTDGWYGFQRWMNKSNENRIHFDMVNNVWLDVNDQPVKVITKPKTVAPLAGKRWAKLHEEDQK